MTESPKKPEEITRHGSLPLDRPNHTGAPIASFSAHEPSKRVGDAPPAEIGSANKKLGSADLTESPKDRILKPRAASAFVMSSKKSSDKTGITQTSSLDGQRMAMTGSQHGPVAQAVFNNPPVAPNTLARTYSGRHRSSGLFSRDDFSIDASVCVSKEQVVARPPDIVGSGSGHGPEKAKQEPLSIAGSSIGSSSLGSEMYQAGSVKKDLHRPLRRRWRRFRRKYKGCIFALLSGFASSLAQYFAHKLTFEREYSPQYCLLWRYVGVLFPGIFIVLYYRFCQMEKVFDQVWPLTQAESLKRFGLSIIRGLVDVGATSLNYLAFQYLLQSETSTILNSKPIIVQLLAHYTLGEPWGIVPVIMSVIAAVGVLVISKPPFLTTETAQEEDTRDFVSERLPGSLYAIGSMLLASIVYCILRYLKDVHYSIFGIFIGVTGVSFGLGMTFGLGVFVMPATGQDLVYFISLAGLVCFSSISIVIALQNEEAFVVSLVRSCDVVFSFVWEMCLNQTYPDWYRGGGAMIIMFSVVVIFFRKYLTHQDMSSKIYKRFQFLTK